MTLLRLPTALRSYADNQKDIELPGTTVSGVLDELGQQYPALRPHLFDEAGGLRPYVNLFLNETDIRSLQGIETRLSDHDRLLIIPSIAGGCGTANAVLHSASHQRAVVPFPGKALV